MEVTERESKLTPADRSRARVRRNIAVAAQLSSPYLIMNALATVVAAYGLLSNSTAVVIGAMIIAMLLGPIMGLALALVDGDVALLRKSLIAEAVGVGLVLFIGFLIGSIHHTLPLTAEILSRTKPNLLDLAIAVAGGAAGAYATVSPRVSSSIVGVAISTALVPPLAACGILVAQGQFGLASGAFILFATNLVAIQCASSLVLFAFGYHELTRRDPNDKGFMQRLAIDGALFLLLAIFLYVQLSKTIQQQQFESRIKSKLESMLVMIPGAYLTETRFRSTNDLDIVVAVVSVPNSITPGITARMQKELPTRGNRPIELHIRSLLTKETVPAGYLHEIEPAAQPIENAAVPITESPNLSRAPESQSDVTEPVPTP